KAKAIRCSSPPSRNNKRPCMVVAAVLARGRQDRLRGCNVVSGHPQRRLIGIGEQESTNGHAGKKYGCDGEHQNAFGRAIIDSTQLFSQKFLIVWGHGSGPLYLFLSPLTDTESGRKRSSRARVPRLSYARLSKRTEWCAAMHEISRCKK